MLFEIGALIHHRYRIEALLGQGAMGAAYKVRDENVGGAARVLKVNLNPDPGSEALFRQEAELLARLDHPGLPTVYDHFVLEATDAGPTPQCLVMKFVEGQSLAQKLAAASGPLPEADVLRWAKDLCEALTYLHTQTPPIVHRDLKPGNVMVDRTGRAILVDFGIAKIMHAPDQRTATVAQRTSHGYAPLEQYTATPTDPRSDLYSLGATLYTLLTNTLPPEAPTRYASRIAPRPVLELNAQVSPPVAQAIQRGLELEPDDRWPTAEAFWTALAPSPAPHQPDANVGPRAMPPAIISPPASTALGKGKDVAASLIRHFREHYALYHAEGHKEAETRQMLIDPLFVALGWDVRYENKTVAPDLREVLVETSLEKGGQLEKVDYNFRRGENTVFFVEAKRPRVKVEGDAQAAYQLRNYGWNKKLALSLLTDFEHLAVYDCRFKPAPADHADRARLKLFPYEEYADRWEEIWAVFSREAVWGGAFDGYIKGGQSQRGTSEVDTEFLKTIEEWRRDLAQAFARHNPGLGVALLNDAVQRIIDRVLFLRMAEGRNIEPYETLKSLAENPPRPPRGKELQGRLYLGFLQLCQEADRKYNSGLFDFSKAGDCLSPSLTLPDDALRPILANLYHPACPYNFHILPVELLGGVYERFLGKVIRLTPSGKTAKVEDKPEVKKAGGVFYTPEAIVDRLVQNTVGKWLEAYAAAHPSARAPFPADFRILDCACGSGSFLLRAYQYLLAYALRWYLAHPPEKHQSAGRIQPEGDSWRLTLAEKKRLLTAHIFGVDIDAQAVEVTKLSLMLKLLDGESQDTYQLELGERLLPSLEGNIRCGNSLIDTPMYLEQKRLAGADPDELKRVKPFDWAQHFPEAMRSGGFDVLVGNPPYIRVQMLQTWAPLEVEIYRRQYAAASSGNYDIYVVFVERALSLLRKQGLLGFILPSKFFATDYGRPLRDLITQRKALHRVVDFGHAQVFAGATTYTCLLFLTAEPSPKVSYLKVDNPANIVAENLSDGLEMESSAFTDNPWLFTTGLESSLAKKICLNTRPLGEIARIGRGSSSGADGLFILKREGKKLYNRKGEEVDVEAELLRTPIYATDFSRYSFSPKSGEVIIFPYEVKEDGYELIAESEIRHTYPKTYAHLAGQRKELEKRKQFKAWYGFSAPRNLDVHAKAQMLVPLLANKGLYARLSGTPKHYCLMASGGFSITITADVQLAPEYVLGLLNSKLLFWRLHSISNVFRGGWITCTKQYVETLPIRVIDFSDAQDKARYDKMVALVGNMLVLRAQLAAAQAPQERTMQEGMIAAMEGAIDALVYELYGLTPDEIAIIDTPTGASVAAGGNIQPIALTTSPEEIAAGPLA